MEAKPTYEQAQLQLKIYNLRRETRLREARDWLFKNYHVQTFDEAIRLAAPGTEEGKYVSMVLSYWDQACALLNYGLLHEEFFFETNGEFFGVWELIKGVLPAFREKFVNKTYLSHIEKAAHRYEAWSERRAPGHIAAMREYMKQAPPKMAKSA